MKSRVIINLFLLSLPSFLYGQTIGPSIPAKITPSGKYLFYLHGGVVTTLGNNAINQSVPEWGPYEYLNILDSLKKRGFYVISERRQPDIHDSVYVNKIAAQIDSLLNRGATENNMIVLGASAGWNIGISVSSKLKNDRLRYVVMGGCWPDDHKNYQDIILYGHFLSIIETTDPHGTCFRLFEKRKQVKSYREIKLNTGLSHGFIYKGYKEWIDPIVEWSNMK